MMRPRFRFDAAARQPWFEEGLNGKTWILKGFRREAWVGKSFFRRPLMLALLYPMNIESGNRSLCEVGPSMFSTGFRNLCSVGLLSSAMFLGFGAFSTAQDKDTKGSGDSGAAGQGSQVDPLKRPIPEKQRKANAKALKIELSKTYRKWLDEDVRWIITDEERSA